MENNYTNLNTAISDDIYFLNGNNIVHELSDTGKLNPVPSLDLLRGTTNVLSDYTNTRIANLSTPVFVNETNGIVEKIVENNGIISITFKQILSNYVSGLSDFVDSKINELNKETISAENKLIFGICENGGIVSAYTRNITDCDFGENNYLPQSRISDLTSDLNNISSAYLKHSGDEIEWLYDKGNLSVGGEIINKSFRTDENRVVIGRDPDGTGTLHGTVEISVENGLDGVKVNGTSLKDSLDSTIQGLDSEIAISNSIITGIKIEDGKLASLSTEMIKDSFVADDAQIAQSKIKDLVADLTKKFNTVDFPTTLCSQFHYNEEGVLNSFRYDREKHVFHMDVCGKDMQIDAKEILQTSAIKSITIETETTGEKYILIKFKDELGIDDIRIPVKDLVQVYKAGEGILITEDLSIKTNPAIIPTKEDVVLSIGNHWEAEKSKLSNTLDIGNGIIKSITQIDGKLESLSSQAITKEDFYIEGGHNTLPLDYIDNLSSELDTLSNEIGTLSRVDWRTLKFNGHLVHGDPISSKNNVQEVFRDAGIFTEMTECYNGSYIEVRTGNRQLYKTLSDNFQVCDGDYIIVHDHILSTKTIPIEKLSCTGDIRYDNVFVLKAGVSKCDIDNLSGDIQELKQKVYENISSCYRDISSVSYTDNYDTCISCVVSIKNMLGNLMSTLSI